VGKRSEAEQERDKTPRKGKKKSEEEILDFCVGPAVATSQDFLRRAATAFRTYFYRGFGYWHVGPSVVVARQQWWRLVWGRVVRGGRFCFSARRGGTWAWHVGLEGSSAELARFVAGGLGGRGGLLSWRTATAYGHSLIACTLLTFLRLCRAVWSWPCLVSKNFGFWLL